MGTQGENRWGASIPDQVEWSGAVDLGTNWKVCTPVVTKDGVVHQGTGVGGEVRRFFLIGGGGTLW